MIGTTYSTAHYEEFKRTGNQNLFEEIIDSMVLDGISGMNESFKRAISNLPLEEKRISILSLLDKDLNLFRKIKALTNKDINRVEHIKDVIVMLRDYVKVGEVEKKKFGEVMTPLELVKEMLATLPEDVWSNPNLKWLDPANGTGPFPAVVIYKLMKGLEEWEPNAEKRYKHIIENMIYTCELQARNVFLWLCVADPFDEYDTNTYWGSFLDEGFDKHMKEVWGLDKVDIVIGNPPFNSPRKENNQSSDIYNIFVEKSNNFSTNILMVTPSRWFVKKSLSSFREKMINEYGLTKIKHFDNNKYFNNTDIKGGISFFLIDKTSKKQTVYFNDQCIDLKNFDIIPNDISIDTFSILNKIKNKKNIQHRFNSQSHFGIKTNDRRLSDNGDIKCYVSKQKGNIKYVSNIDFGSSKINKWKLLIPSASGKGGMFENFFNRIEIAKPGEVCSESFIFFDFDNKWLVI
jgi:site-specific DNA-methyltransferase (adenine-specific)